jgi:hypothetical protein
MPVLTAKLDTLYYQDGTDPEIFGTIRLIEQIESEFGAEQAENLTRKLLNAIRTKDAGKFSRSVRRTNADS